MKALVTDAFTGATERHIEVGDGLSFFLIKKGQGVVKTTLRECCNASVEARHVTNMPRPSRSCSTQAGLVGEALCTSVSFDL